jgi:hypothetical protein
LSKIFPSSMRARLFNARSRVASAACTSACRADHAPGCCAQGTASTPPAPDLFLSLLEQRVLPPGKCPQPQRNLLSCRHRLRCFPEVTLWRPAWLAWRPAAWLQAHHGLWCHRSLLFISQVGFLVYAYCNYAISPTPPPQVCHCNAPSLPSHGFATLRRWRSRSAAPPELLLLGVSCRQSPAPHT